VSNKRIAAWQKISGQPYQCKILDVQLNLTSSDKEPEQWRNVRLLFVRGNTEVEKQDTGKLVNRYFSLLFFIRTMAARESSSVLRSMALVPNQASANKKSTLTPPRMARETDREKKMAEDFRTTLSVQNSGCPTESDHFG
jgi:hypothetical protein